MWEGKKRTKSKLCKVINYKIFLNKNIVKFKFKLLLDLEQI